VAAYLIEALVRLNGYAGLHDGLELMRGLVERYWDDVYPRPDEDGLETTVLPISRLDSEVLTSAVIRVPITDGSSVGPFAVWQFRQAEELRSCKPEERRTRIERGAVTREMFDKASRETGAAFFQETYAEAAACLQELKLLSAALDEKCGPEANVTPTFSTVGDALNEAQAVLRLIAGPRLQVAAARAGAASAGSGEGGNHEGGAMGSQFVDNRLNGREDAFRTLESIAAFFERTEPQSLIPAQLRKVIRWGRMSPSQLYSELIEDSSVREQVFKIVGIERKEESSDGSSGYGSSESQEYESQSYESES
jgi:type VI secretion system protein ImpA